MLSRKERHRKAAMRRRRKWKRLAVHAAALGISALILGAGLHVIRQGGAPEWFARLADLRGAIGAGGIAGGPGDAAGGIGKTGAGTGGGPGSAGETADGPESAGAANSADPAGGSAGDGALETGGRESGTGAAAPGAGPGESAGLPGKPGSPGSPGGGPEGAAEPAVRLLFVGDIMMGGRVAALLEREGYDYPYRQTGEWIRSADLAAGNLENPITDRGEPADKTWTFRMSPKAVPALKESGFDVLNLANNHVLDYGTEGLLDTLRFLDEEGIGRVGAGRDADEAYRAFFTEIKGIRIAFLGFSHVVPEVGWKAAADRPGVAEAYGMRQALEAVKAAKEEADLVVVMVHWGIERAEEPEPYQVTKGRQFIDAGADLVIGSHPHVLQGLESYGGRWIAYSLGNFIFTVNPNADTRQSAMLEAECRADGGCRLAIIPVETGPGQPQIPDEETARAILGKMDRLSYKARVKDDGTVEPDPAGREYVPKDRGKEAEKPGN
jgi:poly-gamma-glutamate synthesis protein (capsule biosynthesis protein)